MSGCCSSGSDIGMRLPACSKGGGRLLIRRVVGGPPFGSAVFPTPSVGCMMSRDDSASAPGRRSSPRSSPWCDLDRPPLHATALRRGLARGGALWREVEVVQSTGSTNSDLVSRAVDGKVAEGAVLVAEEQTAARGRLDRRWTAPARSGLFFSVLLRPAEVPVARW